MKNPDVCKSCGRLFTVELEPRPGRILKEKRYACAHDAREKQTAAYATLEQFLAVMPPGGCEFAGEHRDHRLTELFRVKED
jgi:hypothetical protein